ncbi:putative FRS1-phenylalanyl-tRNA synthetase, beta subunit, cytosolic [Serendipita vermifera]|nr:putative FRS1-phenylalanyl-tRNA synthetase, beta subunit, cytosolic [Serendipita vermifera]
MPTVAVDKLDLYERLGRSYTTEEFDHLCFEFGIELDEDTTDEVEAAAKRGEPVERAQLKIEIPANRSDLLCIEGISRALRVFLQLEKCPQVNLVLPTGGEQNLLTCHIAPEVAQVRAYTAAAILRNVSFTQRNYDSFIDLQDKLHQNICRKRQLVSIGTHDLDTLKPPFRYEARTPTNINFIPLNKDKSYDAKELMTVYESEKHLARYLHIIKDSPVYPVWYDQNDQVLSLPPIINSEHSKITLNTRNVFIELTATDETKLAIVLNTICIMFAEYCDVPFTVEPVRLIWPDGKETITPDLRPRATTASAQYINSCTGLSLSAAEISELLKRMTLEAQPSSSNPDEILVQVPAWRPDILHECDIMEDAAIAYGFNKLVKTFPATNTVAQQLPVSKLCDVVRREWAYAGWVEVLPLILCSHDENFAWMNRKDDGSEVVKLANPKSLEYQVVRTSLLPGLLKTIRENKAHALPIKVFETSDVVVKDKTTERQTRNIRHAAAVWCNKTAGFEVVHGLLDRMMAMLEVPRISNATKSEAKVGYYLKEMNDPTFFPGRAASIMYRSGLEEGGEIVLGVLGILHPTVLANFEIPYPCSALEFDLEPFLKAGKEPWE